MKKQYLLLICMLTGITHYSQEKNPDIGITEDSGINSWYTSPWFWVVIAIFLIALLVMLLRNSRRITGNAKTDGLTVKPNDNNESDAA
ncbi:MAG: hypothetical protein ICV51_10705 [Flavisolibacter sp.]|nr:hypothetical protein [Flavisolibacter sp.]MBD0286423.1 hypothetical protein [Flavisolibacter sp.]MBD0294361.1 hypothetical protein [Flavisolibacter sp.]MBD0350162.1 hypothetical protein [Flavisolibacter sp.]MBD0368031.1 hypothetical protein [Flavisolibacter sp.]